MILDLAYLVVIRPIEGLSRQLLDRGTKQRCGLGLVQHGEDIHSVEFTKGEETVMEEELSVHDKPSLKAPRKYRISIRPVVTFTYIHLAGIYGIYLCFTKAKWETIAFNYLLYIAAEIGITAGAHRLWSHRSYKAKMPLQVILMLFNTLAFQNTATTWVRDHRQHHKFCDTDGDPHNARRGFFYSHIGWLMTRRSEDVLKCGKTIDMSDIYSNPVLRFQKKYAVYLVTAITFVLPTIVPVLCWEETYRVAWCVNMLRYAVNLNASFFVNSAAHLWGYKPYDKSIMPTENVSVSILALGEGFHNYHHVFPWDYQAGEFGNRKLNVTTWFIDFFYWVGWAYGLKMVPDNVVKNRINRTGEGSSLLGSD